MTSSTMVTTHGATYQALGIMTKATQFLPWSEGGRQVLKASWGQGIPGEDALFCQQGRPAGQKLKEFFNFMRPTLRWWLYVVFGCSQNDCQWHISSCEMVCVKKCLKESLNHLQPINQVPIVLHFPNLQRLLQARITQYHSGEAHCQWFTTSSITETIDVQSVILVVGTVNRTQAHDPLRIRPLWETRGKTKDAA